MYVPSLYDAVSAGQIARVVRAHPMALLITNGPEFPHATNLPVVPHADTRDDQVAAGSRLLGHMNRANPHWSALGPETPAKLVFSGPGAYISPVNYKADPAAPTWDFVTVHITGTLQPLPAGDETLAVVARTAMLLEQEFGDGWDQQSSHGYFRSIVHDVGAFEFRVETAESMFKLSQEKCPEIQQRLIDRFSAHEPGSARAELADFMKDHGLGGQQ